MRSFVTGGGRFSPELAATASPFMFSVAGAAAVEAESKASGKSTASSCEACKEKPESERAETARILKMTSTRSFFSGAPCTTSAATARLQVQAGRPYHWTRACGGKPVTSKRLQWERRYTTLRSAGKRYKASNTRCEKQCHSSRCCSAWALPFSPKHRATAEEIAPSEVYTKSNSISGMLMFDPEATLSCTKVRALKRRSSTSLNCWHLRLANVLLRKANKSCRVRPWTLGNRNSKWSTFCNAPSIILSTRLLHTSPKDSFELPPRERIFSLMSPCSRTQLVSSSSFAEVTAVSKFLRPSSSLFVASTPLSSRTSMTSSDIIHFAQSITVWPLWVFMKGSAPLSSKTFVRFLLFMKDAAMSGVQPVELRASMSAPSSIARFKAVMRCEQSPAAPYLPRCSLRRRQHSK
mmetsp:Transcript_7962/g.17267  ORF Transcript_7962/g.17267 Transcript_7962/m.17267 type:complete len:408 (-) Transcript_7962:2262-3485(-)